MVPLELFIAKLIVQKHSANINIILWILYQCTLISIILPLVCGMSQSALPY